MRLDNNPSPLSLCYSRFRESIFLIFFLSLLCLRFVSPLFLVCIRKTMAVRSYGRKLPFEILSQSSSFEDDSLPSIRRSSSDPVSGNDAAESPRDNGKRRRNKKKNKKKNSKATEVQTIPENGEFYSAIANGSVEDSCGVSGDFGDSEIGGVGADFENRLNYFSGGSSGGCVVTLLDGQTVHHKGFNFGELRQRNVNGSVDGSNDDRFSDTMTSEKKMYAEEMGAELSSSENPPFHEVQNQFPRSETNGNAVTRLDTEASLDWKQLMADDPDCKFQTFYCSPSLWLPLIRLLQQVRL